MVLFASVCFWGKLAPVMVTFISSYGGDKVYISGMGIIDLMLSRLWVLVLRPAISQPNTMVANTYSFFVAKIISKFSKNIGIGSYQNYRYRYSIQLGADILPQCTNPTLW
jgi:hypothetical protein